MKESYVQTAIIEYLAAKHVLAFRMNTGAIKMDKRFIRFGVPGMADILAFAERGVDPNGTWCIFIQPVWIECKSSKGVQSDLQKSFQVQVEGHGHKYVVARSIEDVMQALEVIR